MKSGADMADIVLFDECHGAAAEGLSQTLVRLNKPRLFGFSATPKGRLDKADILVEAIFGPVIFRYEYQKAVEDGTIAPIHVYMYKIDGAPIRQKHKTWKKRFGIWQNSRRNQAICQFARHYPAEVQLLILVDTIEHGVMLKRMLP